MTHSQAPDPAPHHCAPPDIAALIARLEALADPEQEAFPSFADTDWRTLSSVCARVIGYLAAAITAPEGELRIAAQKALDYFDNPADGCFSDSDLAELRAALAAPAPQAPVALTDEQLTEILASHAGPTITPHQIARAIEAALLAAAPQTKEPTNER